MLLTLIKWYNDLIFFFYYLKSEQSFSAELQTTLASHDTREERGMSFAAVGSRSLSRSNEEKWVVSQQTIVARRERGLRTPPSYLAERGPRKLAIREKSFPITFSLVFLECG